MTTDTRIKWNSILHLWLYIHGECSSLAAWSHLECLKRCHFISWIESVAISYNMWEIYKVFNFLKKDLNEIYKIARMLVNENGR